jgi:broad specificity phosphatase PhoE
MLGRRLAGHPFGLVLTSPLSRASDTASLAGFGDTAVADPDLMEWDYGSMEGLQTAEIQARFRGWTIWRGPWPGGETLAQVAARADRIVARARSAGPDGDVLVFAHGHLLRILAARWLGLPAVSGGLFALGTGTLSALGWEHETPVVQTWNEACQSS